MQWDDVYTINPTSPGFLSESRSTVKETIVAPGRSTSVRIFQPNRLTRFSSQMREIKLFDAKKEQGSYNRAALLTSEKIGMTGFEPATSWSQTRRSSQAELHPARAESLGSDDQTVNVAVSRETKTCQNYAARCNLPTIRSKSSFDPKSIIILPLSLAFPESLISTLAPSQSRS